MLRFVHRLIRFFWFMKISSIYLLSHLFVNGILPWNNLDNIPLFGFSQSGLRSRSSNSNRSYTHDRVYSCNRNKYSLDNLIADDRGDRSRCDLRSRTQNGNWPQDISLVGYNNRAWLYDMLSPYDPLRDNRSLEIGGKGTDLAGDEIGRRRSDNIDFADWYRMSIKSVVGETGVECFLTDILDVATRHFFKWFMQILLVFIQDMNIYKYAIRLFSYAYRPSILKQYQGQLFSGLRTRINKQVAKFSIYSHFFFALLPTLRPVDSSSSSSNSSGSPNYSFVLASSSGSSSLTSLPYFMTYSQNLPSVSSSKFSISGCSFSKNLSKSYFVPVPTNGTNFIGFLFLTSLWSVRYIFPLVFKQESSRTFYLRTSLKYPLKLPKWKTGNLTGEPSVMLTSPKYLVQNTIFSGVYVPDKYSVNILQSFFLPSFRRFSSIVSWIFYLFEASNSIVQLESARCSVGNRSSLSTYSISCSLTVSFSGRLNITGIVSWFVIKRVCRSQMLSEYGFFIFRQVFWICSADMSLKSDAKTVLSSICFAITGVFNITLLNSSDIKQLRMTSFYRTLLAPIFLCFRSLSYDQQRLWLGSSTYPLNRSSGSLVPLTA